MPEITYRRGNTDDLNEIIELNVRAYGKLEPFISEQYLDDWKKGLRNMSTYQHFMNDGICFVAERDARIVGTAFLLPSGNPDEIFKSEWSHIRYVGVEPSLQGHGIGRRLTTLCLDHAISLGESIIALHTSDIQPNAMHIYESMGFVKQYPFTRRGIEFYLFHKQLK